MKRIPWGGVVDTILIVLGVLVVGVGGLYWKVFAIELGFDGDGRDTLETESLLESFHDTIVDATRIQPSSQDYQQESKGIGSVYALDLEQEVYQSNNVFDHTFSTLPPGRFLRIPRLGIETPIVDIPFATPEKIEQGDFDSELRQGVVKYPFTALPGEQGNTLLFGHSSVDSFEEKDNPFGFVFYSLPKLEAGDLIELIRDGKTYEYEIVEKQIARPANVPDMLNKEYNHHQLTLMACYPILSDAQRIIVTAQLKDTDLPTI